MNENSPVLVIDAGHINIDSELADTKVVEEIKSKDIRKFDTEDTKKLENLMYDKFNLQFWTLVSGVAVFAHNAYKDVVEIGNTIRGDSELVWTLARVPILTSSDHRGYHAGYIGDGKTKTHLPRLAYAVFVIEELERNEWTRKAPMISISD